MNRVRINLPNQITLARLGLALAFFVAIGRFDARGYSGSSQLLVACFWMFLLAAMGDVLDGYLARTLKQITSFGRIIDPVVDKVMICGAFVYFASPIFWDGAHNLTGVEPWMVIVILLRELLVTGIRAHVEASGEPFAAVWIGKLKMAVQCTAACVILGTLGWNLTALAWLREALLWLTVAVTTISALLYVGRAHRFLLSSAALDASAEDAATNGIRPVSPTDFPMFNTAAVQTPPRAAESTARSRPTAVAPRPGSVRASEASL